MTVTCAPVLSCNGNGAVSSNPSPFGAMYDGGCAANASVSLAEPVAVSGASKGVAVDVSLVAATDHVTSLGGMLTPVSAGRHVTDIDVPVVVKLASAAPSLAR